MHSVSRPTEREHALSKVLKYSTSQCVPLMISRVFHFQRHSDLQLLYKPGPMSAWHCHRTAEGVPQHAACRPSHSNYLPLFQPESAPVSMTTWSLFCSVGLDIQSVFGEGCRGATQQMHFSQQDALLLPSTAWMLGRQCRWSLEPPFLLLFCCFLFLVSMATNFCVNLSLVSLATGLIVTYFCLV